MHAIAGPDRPLPLTRYQLTQFRRELFAEQFRHFAAWQRDKLLFQHQPITQRCKSNLVTRLIQLDEQLRTVAVEILAAVS